MKIPCTIGILTFNSEENLARALESVKDFAEIVIADGGSTDGTREIAQRYGAHIIDQSNPGHPIEDFALERNRTLEAATSRWFFHLDSDEIMSPKLVEHIRLIANDVHHLYGAYRVRYLKTSEDGTKPYRTFQEYYQIRLTRTDVGAVYERRIHERLVIPLRVPVGQTDAPWYVPLKHEDLTLKLFARKAWRRTGMTAAAWHPKSAGDVVQKILVEPIVLIAKSLFKMIVVKIRWGKYAIPAKYELLRILYSVFLSAQCLSSVCVRSIRRSFAAEV